MAESPRATTQDSLPQRRSRSLRQGRRSRRCGRLAAQGARRPGPRGARGDAGLRRGGGSVPRRPARHSPAPGHAPGAHGQGAHPGRSFRGDAARQQRAGLLHRRTGAFREPAVLLRLRGRRLSLCLLRPGGARPGHRGPGLAARRGPRPRLARRGCYVTWLATSGRHDERYAGLPTVYTIHNLMHQGTRPPGKCSIPWVCSAGGLRRGAAPTR